MKHVKKVLAFLLVLCMAMEPSVSTFAVDRTASNTETTAEAASEQETQEAVSLQAQTGETLSDEQQTEEMLTDEQQTTEESSTKQEETLEKQLSTSARTEESLDTAAVETAAETASSKAASKPADGENSEQPFPSNIGVGHYRIPAIQTLSDGTLVASADARWGAWQNPDDCANIDTIVSRSVDNGKNWSYTFANYIADSSNTRDFKAATFIDPSLATDGTTLYMLTDLFPGQNESKNCSVAAQTGTGFDDNGNLLLKANASASAFSYYLKDGKIYQTSDNKEVTGYSVDAYFNLSKDGEVLGNLFTYSTSYFQPLMTSYLYFTTSNDGGATWSEPRLIPAKKSTENYYLVGPGRGLVTTDGTIIFPCYTKLSGSQFCTSLFYSADGGTTWNRSESAKFDTSEGDVVELADGTLRYFYRHNTGDTTKLQYVDITGDAKTGYTFGSAVTVSGVTVYSGCNLSAITYSKTIDGKQVILVSCPTSSRTTGKIFTFTVESDKQLKLVATYTVNGTDAYSYSSLTEQKDGSIGLLYEKGDSGSITYTNLAVETVAAGVTFDSNAGSDGSDGAETPGNGSDNSDGSNDVPGNGNETTDSESPNAETVDVQLYVGQEKTYTIEGKDYTGNVGEYDTRYVDIKVDRETGSVEKETKKVSEIESGKSYLIYNTNTKTLLTSTSSSYSYSLKLDGQLSADSTELWKITKTNNGYAIQNAGGMYLTISSYNASLSEASNNALQLSSSDGKWQISQKVWWLNYYLTGSNSSGNVTSSSSASAQWEFYEIVETEASVNTTVSIKGLSEGETSVQVGHVTYRITVLPLPDYVVIETTPFLGGQGQGDGQKLTGLVITAGTTYPIKLADGKTATSWTSADAATATVKDGTVTGVKAGETTITAVIDGVAYTIPVTVLPGPTSTDRTLIDAYSAQVTNCTAYYSINSGKIVEFKLGTQVYAEYNKGETRLITFWAKPKEGYALTWVGDKSGTYFHAVRNEAGTGYGYQGTTDDDTLPKNSTGYTYFHDQLIGFVVNNTGSKAATVAEVHDLLNRATELECDGGYLYSKGTGYTDDIVSYASFIAEPLPTVTKTVSKVNGESYVAGKTAIHVGDTITFDVDVTQYAPKGEYDAIGRTDGKEVGASNITYTNENLKDNLEKALFANNKKSTITPTLSDTAVSSNTTTTYEVTYLVTEADLDTKIRNTVDLTYTYQSKYSKGISKRSAQAEASVSVLTGTPDDLVIDFGLPVTLDCSKITSYDFKEGSALYGTVAVSGKTATYTPNQTLKGADLVTLTNEKGAEYQFTVYPATTIYYEETFAKATGFKQIATGTGNGTQQTAVPGQSDAFQYGYDAAYAKEQTGPSAGTELVSEQTGDTAEFTFTGTGVDIYANTSATSGTVSIQVKQGDTLKKLLAVDTSMKVGTSAATSGQSVTAYQVPIASIQMREAGTYTVIISQVKSKNADCTNRVSLDGFRVYNTLQTEEANEVYTKDNEANPTYTELRNHVLSGLNVESVKNDSQYANQIAGNIWSQIYASEDVKGGAVILDSASNPYTEGNVKDLLDNGPKNELYLYPGQTVTFKLKAAAQIGLKALDQTVTYCLNNSDQNVTLTSSTDMFYKVGAGTVTIYNAGNTGILSITKVKACNTAAATDLFADLTEADLMPALLSLGYEAEKPIVDAVMNVNLVDYTGNVIASTALTASGEEGSEAVFGAETVKEAAHSILPEGYAFAEETAITDQTAVYGKTAETTVLIGKVATLQVTYKKLFGQTVGTAVLTGIQTAEGDTYSFSAADIKNAIPDGYWTVKLLGTKVKYGDVKELTVTVF